MDVGTLITAAPDGLRRAAVPAETPCLVFDGHVAITQLVDKAVCGVHVRMPKSSSRECTGGVGRRQ